METKVQVAQESVQGVEQKRRKREKGFTLIEMLAVVLILAIVSGIGFVVVNKQIEGSRDKTDKANVRIIADAVQRYVLDKNSTTITVDALVTDGYLAQTPVDPWGKGQQYGITVSGNDVTVTGVKSENTITLKNVLP